MREKGTIEKTKHQWSLPNDGRSSSSCFSHKGTYIRISVHRLNIPHFLGENLLANTILHTSKRCRSSAPEAHNLPGQLTNLLLLPKAVGHEAHKTNIQDSRNGRNRVLLNALGAMSNALLRFPLSIGRLLSSSLAGLRTLTLLLSLSLSDGVGLFLSDAGGLGFGLDLWTKR